MRLALAILLCSAGAAVAEPTYQVLDRASTPQGDARIRADHPGDPEYLLIGDRTAYASVPGGHVGIAAQAGSLLLLSVGDGGTACPAEFVWLHAEDPEFRTSERFGTCSELIEVSHDAETVTVAMPDSVATGLRAYVYDGHRVIARSLGLPDAPLAPGSAADDWIGRYPSDLLGARDWQPVLATFMDKTDIRRAQAMMQRVTPFEVEGDWVVGTGWDALDPTTVAVGLHRMTGEMIVAWRIGEDESALFREGSSPMPPSILALVDVD